MTGSPRNEQRGCTTKDGVCDGDGTPVGGLYGVPETFGVSVGGPWGISSSRS